MIARSTRTIQTRGAGIHITESGSGEPTCVFLHYWGGSGRTWDDVIDRIGERARCFAVDHRGWVNQLRPTGGTISPLWPTTSKASSRRWACSDISWSGIRWAAK